MSITPHPRQFSMIEYIVERFLRSELENLDQPELVRNICLAASRRVETADFTDCGTALGNCVTHMLCTWPRVVAAIEQLSTELPHEEDSVIRLVERGAVPGIGLMALLFKLPTTYYDNVEVELVLEGPYPKGMEIGHTLIHRALVELGIREKVYLFPVAADKANTYPKPVLTVSHSVDQLADGSPALSLVLEGGASDPVGNQVFSDNMAPFSWFAKLDGYVKLPQLVTDFTCKKSQTRASAVTQRVLEARVMSEIARPIDYYRLGRVLKAKGQEVRAAVYYARAVRSGISDAAAVLAIADYYIGVEKYEQAEYVLDRLGKNVDPFELNSRYSTLATKPGTERYDAWRRSTEHLAKKDVYFSCFGGASEIGGSAHLLQIGGVGVLLDAGMYPSGRSSSLYPEFGGLYNVQAALISHGHLDHIGALPKLHYIKPQLPIFMTEHTLHLTRVLLQDSIRIKKRSEYALEEDEARLLQDFVGIIEETLSCIQPMPFDKWFPLGGGLEALFYPAGHILGAAGIVVRGNGVTVMYTGDTSSFEQLTCCGPRYPEDLRPDLLIMENTYAGAEHANREAQERDLIEKTASVIRRGGTVLFPSFAIGRSQEVAAILRRAQQAGLMPECPIYLDGMVRAVTEIYDETREDADLILAPPVYAVNDRMDRSALAEECCIIIASSGMLTGGVSPYYASQLLPNSRNAIIFTGYLDEDSPGAVLGRLKAGKPFGFAGSKVKVNCQVETYKLSAHSDRRGLTTLIAGLRPRAVVLVHGSKPGSFVHHLERTLPFPCIIKAPLNGVMFNPFHMEQSSLD